MVVNSVYSKDGSILSTYSKLVNQCEFNKFWNLFDDGTHQIEIYVKNEVYILHIKLFI